MIQKKHIVLAYALLTSCQAGIYAQAGIHSNKPVRNVPFFYEKGGLSELPAAVRLNAKTFDKNGNLTDFTFAVSAGSEGRNLQLFSQDEGGTKFIPNYEVTQPRYSLQLINPDTDDVLFESFPNLELQHDNVRYYVLHQNTVGDDLSGSSPSNLIKNMQDQNEENLIRDNKITFRPINEAQAKSKYGPAAFKGGQWLKLKYPFELEVNLGRDREGAKGGKLVFLVEESGGKRLDTVIKIKH